MKGSVGKGGFTKKSVAVFLVVGCFALSFGASAYGAHVIFGQAQQRAEAKVAAEEAKVKDPYDLGFIVEDSEKDLEIETYQQGTVLNYLYMFGSDYYDLYFDPEVCRDRAAYHPIYDYLTRMYLDERASAGMHPGAVDRLITELVERIIYGVPDDYGVDVGEFYRFGQEYYAEAFIAGDMHGGLHAGKLSSKSFSEGRNL